MSLINANEVNELELCDSSSVKMNPIIVLIDTSYSSDKMQNKKYENSGCANSTDSVFWQPVNNQDSAEETDWSIHDGNDVTFS